MLQTLIVSHQTDKTYSVEQATIVTVNRLISAQRGATWTQRLTADVIIFTCIVAEAWQSRVCAVPAA